MSNNNLLITWYPGKRTFGLVRFIPAFFTNVGIEGGAIYSLLLANRHEERDGMQVMQITDYLEMPRSTVRDKVRKLKDYLETEGLFCNKVYRATDPPPGILHAAKSKSGIAFDPILIPAKGSPFKWIDTAVLAKLYGLRQRGTCLVRGTSYNGLATMLGTTRQRISRSVIKLEACGVVVVDRKPSDWRCNIGLNPPSKEVLEYLVDRDASELSGEMKEFMSPPKKLGGNTAQQVPNTGEVNERKISTWDLLSTLVANKGYSAKLQDEIVHLAYKLPSDHELVIFMSLIEEAEEEHTKQLELGKHSRPHAGYLVKWKLEQKLNRDKEQRLKQAAELDYFTSLGFSV